MSKGADFAAQLSREIRASGRTQQEWAQAMGISEQYLSDVKLRHRLPSPAFVEKLVKYLGEPEDRQHWHYLAARQHGWRL